MKLLSIAIPCYNSEAYMEKCIESLLKGGEDVEILVVNDGSSDRTAEISDAYAEKYPTIIKAVHQENGGHGEAVNAGIRNATGLYFKVVDSDDWVNEEAYAKILHTLGELVRGPETVDMFYRLGLIRNTADLYKLTADDIKGLDRMGEKSAENIVTGIAQSKTVPFERVIFALGIRFVGETVAKKIAKSFENIDDLQQADLEKLVSIDEIGEKIAQSILAYFANESNRELVNRLKEAGLQLYRTEEDLSGYTDKLAGQSIVISGVFIHHSRDEYKELIEKNGGKNVGSISAKTSFILAGDNMGPAKLEKAKKLGITILSEDEFLKLIS